MIRATSKAAERRNRKHKEAQKAWLLRLIKRRPATGYTRQELSKVTRLPIQTICPRDHELLTESAIKNAGFCRESRYGNSCMVLLVKKRKA